MAWWGWMIVGLAVTVGVMMGCVQVIRDLRAMSEGPYTQEESDGKRIQ